MLAATNLSKTFGHGASAIHALSQLSFTINSGELVGLLGPNGAGKSTTMRLLAGYLSATSGQANINSYNLATQLQSAQKSVGYLAEVPPQEDDLTPHHLLSFHARSHGLPDVTQRVQTTAQLTRCHTFLHRPMGQLSKGMKQRVHLACALIHNPPVLLLDEPTDGLDPNQKHELRLMLKELAKTKAVLVSTHLLDEAEHLFSRLLILHRGKLLMDTTPAELARQGKGDMHRAFRTLTTNRGGE